MTLANNKNRGLDRAEEATNQKSTNKARQSTKQFTKCWRLVWQTYAYEMQDGHPIPWETKTTTHFGRPSEGYLHQLRKFAHGQGFKLAAIHAPSDDLEVERDSTKSRLKPIQQPYNSLIEATLAVGFHCAIALIAFI